MLMLVFQVTNSQVYNSTFSPPPPPPPTMTQCSLLILMMKNNKPKEINYKHSGSEFVKCCNVDVSQIMLQPKKDNIRV